MTGRVKWFDAKKGFGFITPDDGSDEVFVHHTGIGMNGFRKLEQGNHVAFEVKREDKGPRAVKVLMLPADWKPLTVPRHD